MGIKDHYLQRQHIAIIFLSFAVLAAPLSIVQLAPLTDPIVAERCMVVYFIVFGNTHFVITWALYFNHRNLQHFRSSQRRTIVYFVVPPAILIAFCVIGILN